MEVNGSIFFHFHGGRTVPELSPEACGCQGPLGTNELYWSWPASTLCLGALFQLRARHPVLAWAMLWPCLSLTLPSGQTHVVVLSPVLPLALVCWMDLGSGWFLCLLWGCWWDSLQWLPGSAPCSDPAGLHPVGEGMACAGFPVAPGSSPLTAQPCSRCSLTLLPQRRNLCPVRNPQWEIQSNRLERLKWTGEL